MGEIETRVREYVLGLVRTHRHSEREILLCATRYLGSFRSTTTSEIVDMWLLSIHLPQIVRDLSRMD